MSVTFTMPDWAGYTGSIVGPCPLKGWDLMIYVDQYELVMPFRRDEVVGQ